MDARKIPQRRDGRVIIHFVSALDEVHTYNTHVLTDLIFPGLRLLLRRRLRSADTRPQISPLCGQQKHIIVTCNYEARRRGLHKLQLIRDARRICPDVIIELGEDISRFRDASKELYNFLKAFSWNGKVERLGFDEVS